MLYFLIGLIKILIIEMTDDINLGGGPSISRNELNSIIKDMPNSNPTMINGNQPGKCIIMYILK
jgi:hypothetical protein